MLQPPSFWTPVVSVLADITAWFDWDALSAIGTVGATWFLVIQTTRQGRGDRARAIGTLTFLSTKIEPLEVISIYEDTDNASLKATPREWIEKDLQIVRRAMAAIETISVQDAGFVDIVQWTSALPLALRDIEEALETQSIDEYGSVLSSMRYVEEALAHVRMERERLKYGWLRRVIRRRRGHLRTAPTGPIRFDGFT